MTIDEVHKFANFIIRQSNSGVYVSPAEMDMVLNKAQIQYFNKLYGNQNDYRYDRPVPRISHAVTEKISNSLSPFLVSNSVSADVNGQIAAPSNLFQTVSISKNINGVPYEVTRVEQDRVANNLTSYYDAPSDEFPIYTQLSDKFQFYPATSGGSYDFKYLKEPDEMEWGYNIVNGRPVYAASASVDPEWKDTDINEIIYLALSYIGVNIKDADVSQFANMKTQTGL